MSNPEHKETIHQTSKDKNESLLLCKIESDPSSISLASLETSLFNQN